MKLNRTSEFSAQREHRFTLWRCTICRSQQCTHLLDEKPHIQFIGLNPSTADEVQNDPTVTRCMDFASRWGYDQMVMTNIFAFRATDPEDMKKAEYHAHVTNNYWILKLAAGAGMVLCGWGNHGTFQNRGDEVKSFLKIRKIPLHCLKITNLQQPIHPLYQPSDSQPIPFK